MKTLLFISTIAIAFNTIALILYPSMTTGFVLLLVANCWCWSWYLYQNEKVLVERDEQLKREFPINNRSCKYYYPSGLSGVCAVNPYGPCQECKDYEPNPQATKK